MEWWQWIAAVITAICGLILLAMVIVPWVELIKDERRIDEWQKNRWGGKQ